jgi:ABC-type phosphate transport system substrate-binding protein
MRFMTFLMPVIAGTLLVLPAQARDYVSLAGSSTVLPFATIIAEAMGKTQALKHRLSYQVAHQSAKKVFVKALVLNLLILVRCTGRY